MKLSVNGIAVDCILGDLPEEREAPQPIKVDLVLVIDDAAAKSDELSDTVDYVKLAENVRLTLTAAKCRMLERAALLVAEQVKRFDHVNSVTARVTKSGVVPGIESASVEVTL